MLQTIKRWFSGSPGNDWTAAQEWAEQRRFSFKRTRDSAGFVIDAGTASTGWRMEWGPSQRPYISGSELRLRGEIGAVDLQMVVLSRQLMEAMEKAVFEQFTEGLQTRADTSTPEEMRWLVMFPKVPTNELRGMREHFGAASSVPLWLPQWLDGPLAAELKQARATWLAAEDPLALVIQRGRLTLRTAMPTLDAARLTAVLALFDVALREARRIAQQWTDNGVASTQPALWSSSGPPSGDSKIG
jgi:hypothetical protein